MKKLMMGALLAAMGLVAKAEETYQYLYWQVLPETVASDVDDYNVAYLYVLDGDEVKTAISVTGWNEMQTAEYRTASELVGTGNLSNYVDGNYNLLWELAFWDGKKSTAVAESKYAFSDVKDYLIVPTSGSEIPQQKVFMPANFTAVPEPTSGVLLLLGMAGLALKRKRG